MVEKHEEGGCKPNTSGTEGSGQNIQTGGWRLPTRSIRTNYAGLINASFIKKKKILLKRSFIMYDVYQFYIKMDQFSLEK